MCLLEDVIKVMEGSAYLDRTLLLKHQLNVRSDCHVTGYDTELCLLSYKPEVRLRLVQA